MHWEWLMQVGMNAAHIWCHLLEVWQIYKVECSICHIIQNLYQHCARWMFNAPLDIFLILCFCRPIFSGLFSSLIDCVIFLLILRLFLSMLNATWALIDKGEVFKFSSTILVLKSTTLLTSFICYNFLNELSMSNMTRLPCATWSGCTPFWRYNYLHVSKIIDILSMNTPSNRMHLT